MKLTLPLIIFLIGTIGFVLNRKNLIYIFFWIYNNIDYFISHLNMININIIFMVEIPIPPARIPTGIYVIEDWLTIIWPFLMLFGFIAVTQRFKFIHLWGVQVQEGDIVVQYIIDRWDREGTRLKKLYSLNTEKYVIKYIHNQEHGMFLGIAFLDNDGQFIQRMSLEAWLHFAHPAQIYQDGLHYFQVEFTASLIPSPNTGYWYQLFIVDKYLVSVKSLYTPTFYFPWNAFKHPRREGDYITLYTKPAFSRILWTAVSEEL
jgi:hypothetical protein